MGAVSKYFEFEKLGTNWKREVLAGLTTFLTMAYIIIVNPAILEAAGIPKGPSMVATIICAFVGTILMGVYAKRPFGLAPYMGENAFVAFTVCGILGIPWQTALGAIFIAGVAFTILTITKLRAILADAIPESLKFSFAVGIGLFLAFIGLNEMGFVTVGTPGAPVKVGDITQWKVLLSVLGFIFIAVLMLFRVRGSILIGILLTAFIAYLTKVEAAPSGIVSLPPDPSPILFKLDVLGALTWKVIPVVLIVFLLDFVDTIGTLIGVSARAGFLDEHGNMPQFQKPLLADALSTVVAALAGTTTAGTFIESAAGIEEGGRSGLTAVVTAFLFLFALFFAPILTTIPAIAYGPALIIVGILMMGAITKINFSDMSEVIPAFATIALMSFTYNIGVGIMAGFVLYPLLKLVKGDFHELTWPRLVLGAFSLVFFIFYPYH